jgi:hypothetical protein
MKRIVKTIVVGFVGLVLAALPCKRASAWSHANRWGGSTSHSYGSGSTTRTDAWGGSETHTYGQGTSATSAYGGTAYHGYGSGYTTYHPSSGGTYYGSSYDHYYGGNSRR